MKHQAASRLAGAFVTLGSSVLLCAPQSFAHHSTAEYDASSFAEARGEVVSVLWRNPHVRFQVSTKSIDGSDQLWEVESADLTRLDRAGLPRDILKVGDVITFAGNPSTRRDRRMYVTNLLVVDGREILLRNNVKARWAPERVVNTDPTPPPTTAAVRATGNGFFGKVFVPQRGGQAPGWLAEPPLTPAARDGKAGYDEVVDDPVLGCVSPGMPRVMLRSGPYAIRFIERGPDVILQNEWFEIDRVIHMDGRDPPADQPYTPLGYSAGKREGESLVVTTTHIDWPYFAALRPRRRAAESGDADRRALHAERRRRVCEIRLVSDGSRRLHRNRHVRRLRHVSLESFTRLLAVRLRRGRAQGAQRPLSD